MPAGAPAGLGGRTAQPLPGPTFRGQAPDEPESPPPPPAAPLLRLPTPEELGLAAERADSAGFDWSAAHHRLDHLGAVCFRLDKLPQGSSRVTCLLPTAQPGRTHHVEAEAPTDAEAVRLALERAEAWSGEASRGR
jgi:hypothetical protein